MKYDVLLKVIWVGHDTCPLSAETARKECAFRRAKRVFYDFKFRWQLIHYFHLSHKYKPSSNRAETVIPLRDFPVILILSVTSHRQCISPSSSPLSLRQH